MPRIQSLVLGLGCITALLGGCGGGVQAPNFAEERRFVSPRNMFFRDSHRATTEETSDRRWNENGFVILVVVSRGAINRRHCRRLTRSGLRRRGWRRCSAADEQTTDPERARDCFQHGSVFAVLGRNCQARKPPVPAPGLAGQKFTRRAERSAAVSRYLSASAGRPWLGRSHCCRSSRSARSRYAPLSRPWQRPRHWLGPRLSRSGPWI